MIIETPNPDSMLSSNLYPNPSLKIIPNTSPNSKISPNSNSNLNIQSKYDFNDSQKINLNKDSIKENKNITISNLSLKNPV